jgi:plasmid stabilization system protein ParE
VKLTVSPEAAVDLERLRAFLSDKNPAAAARAIAVLTAAVQSLETFPERGRPSSTPNVRDLIVPFGHSDALCIFAAGRGSRAASHLAWP